MPTIHLKEADGKLTVRQNLSSEEFDTAVNFWANPLDWLYTYFFRYPRLWSNDWAQNLRQEHSSQGVSIDFIARHRILGTLLTGFMIVISFFSILAAWRHGLMRRFIGEAKAKESIRSTDSKLRIAFRCDENAPAAAANGLLHLTEDDIDALNFNAQEIFKKHPNDFQRIRWGSFRKEENAEPTFEFYPILYPRNAFYSFWKALVTGSFVYWILWIMTGVVLGLLGTGIAGVSIVTSFVAPAIPMVIFLGLKVGHWINNRYFNPAIDPSVEEALEFEKLMNKMYPECPVLAAPAAQNDNAHASVEKQHVLFRCVAQGLRYAVSASILQYILWYLSDTVFPWFLTYSVPFVGPLAGILGVACFALAAIWFCLGVYRKYYDILDRKNDSQPLNVSDECEDYRAEIEIQKRIQATSEKADEVRKEKGYTGVWWDILWYGGQGAKRVLDSPLFTFGASAMTAIFVARLFYFPVTTSSFMPGLESLISHAALCSNPIVCVILIGVAFATFVYFVDEKEKYWTRKDRLAEAGDDASFMEKALRDVREESQPRNLAAGEALVAEQSSSPQGNEVARDNLASETLLEMNSAGLSQALR